jgi:hypothetical protein
VQLPDGPGKDTVRNLMKTPQGNLWLACSGVNGIAFVHIHPSSKSKSRSSAGI